MKKLISLLFFATIFNWCNAQLKLTLEAGVGLATFSGSDKVSWGAANSDPKSRVRFNIGLSTKFPVSELFTFEPGLMYSMKGPDYKGVAIVYNPETYELTEISTHKKVELSYLEAPLIVSFKAGKKIHLVGGLKPGLLLSATHKIDPETGSSPDTNAKDEYKRMEVSIVTGMKYNLKERFDVQLSYETGLNNIAKVPYRPMLQVNGSQTIHNYYTSSVRNSLFKLTLFYKIKS